MTRLNRPLNPEKKLPLELLFKSSNYCSCCNYLSGLLSWDAFDEWFEAACLSALGSLLGLVDRGGSSLLLSTVATFSLCLCCEEAAASDILTMSYSACFSSLIMNWKYWLLLIRGSRASRCSMTEWNSSKAREWKPKSLESRRPRVKERRTRERAVGGWEWGW